MENVIFHGQKIGAWAAWSIYAKADTKEANVEPIEVKANEEAAVEKAALGKEATYEQRVEAWIERFGNKADGTKATKETARAKAVLKKNTIEESPFKRIVFLKGETLEESLVEEGFPPMKAISKGSPEVEEGCSPGEVLEIRAP